MKLGSNLNLFLLSKTSAFLYSGINRLIFAVRSYLDALHYYIEFRNLNDRFNFDLQIVLKKMRRHKIMGPNCLNSDSIGPNYVFHISSLK